MHSRICEHFRIRILLSCGKPSLKPSKAGKLSEETLHLNLRRGPQLQSVRAISRVPSMAHILVVSQNSHVDFHLALELELIQSHIDAGDEVSVLHCDSSTGACRWNMNEKPLECQNCLYRRVRAMRLVRNGTIHEFFMNTYLTAETVDATAQALSVLKTFDDVRQFKVDGMPLGWGALAGYTSIRRDIRGNMPDAVSEIKSCLRGALRAFYGFQSFLLQHKDIEKIYIFNGRFEISKSLECAARLRFPGLRENLIAMEVGCSPQTYALFQNMTLFERRLQREMIELSWSNEPNFEKKKSIASDWYRDRRRGVPREYVSFVAGQDAGKLPHEFDHSRRNIAVFLSSEDEIQTLGGDWDDRLYPTQFQGLMSILRDCKTLFPELLFWIRMHPNSAANADLETSELRSLQSANARVIPPESKISTYTLADNCEKVLTFGSTVGIEAAFQGQPSILCGPAVYEELGSCYVATSHDQVVDLCGRSLAPLSNLGALKFGYHYATLGTPFRYWKSSAYFEGGSFNGQSIITKPRNGIATLINRIAQHHGSQSMACRALGWMLEALAGTRTTIKQLTGQKVDARGWSPMDANTFHF